MGNEMSEGQDSGVRGGRSQLPNLPCLFRRGIRSGREQGRRTGQDSGMGWDEQRSGLPGGRRYLILRRRHRRGDRYRYPSKVG